MFPWYSGTSADMYCMHRTLSQGSWVCRAGACAGADERPDFLPMFPWYSGTSADMYRTIFDLAVSLKLFLGRFDMRTMQARARCCFTACRVGELVSWGRRACELGPCSPARPHGGRAS